MLGFDCCSHFCSHPLATPEVFLFYEVMVGCSHSNNLGSDGYELLLLSTCRRCSKQPTRLSHMELRRSQELATNLATLCGCLPLGGMSANAAPMRSERAFCASERSISRRGVAGCPPTEGAREF